MKRKDSVRILRGDNRETLFQLKPETIQTIVTSPPYWSVRDYETHPVQFEAMSFVPAVGLPAIAIPEWTGQLGLEPNPWWFIGHLLLTFNVAARVLRNDGTLWVNMGDTYYTGAGAVGDCPGGGKQGKTARGKKLVNHHTTPNRMPIAGYKPKDLVGIPWMLAKAMQAQGWTLRGEIIWHKPNPMPGSQKDRPTTAHEYLFLFSKSEYYFYDNVAVMEPKESAVPCGGLPVGWETGTGGHTGLKGRYRPSAKRGEFNGKTEAMAGNERNAFRAVRTVREKRSVWSIPSSPYKGAHFATFPPELVRPCLAAATSEKGACPHCGAAWQRITRPTEKPLGEAVQGLFGPEPVQTVTDIETVGWRPRCICGSDPALELKHDDLETFETPTGEQIGEDDSVQRGRRGIGREAINVGKRLITKYEHRKYAEQLTYSPHRSEMEAEASERGKDAFDHYLRTDKHGARPIPPELLERWLDRQWLQWVNVPEWKYPTPVPCVAADIFAGSGTVGQVAIEMGRHAVLCELAEHYIPLIEERTINAHPPLL